MALTAGKARNGSGFNRTRRSLFKAVGVTAGAVVASSMAPRQASAQLLCDLGLCGSGGTCFLRGTRIRTADGYRPIEALAAGDRVAARFAGFVAIEAIDSFILSRSGPRQEWQGPSRPVRIKRGALGPGSPREDLCLTASHAVFADGFLVPVGDLVNGTSIVFETAEGQDTLEFFHLELARHDILDAEGAPCESRRAPALEPCVPLLGFTGGRSEVRSRLRSAVSLVVDRRQPIDIIRDTLEERGLELARAA